MISQNRKEQTIANCSTRFESITEVRLEKIIYPFENKFPTGSDDIYKDIIEKVLPVILKHLTHLVNYSLISGIFSDGLKVASYSDFEKGILTKDDIYRLCHN